MNILIINSNNPLITSGIVALDIYNGFKNKGHNVRLLVNEYDSKYPKGIVSKETHYLVLKKKILGKLRRILYLQRNVITDPNYHMHELQEQKTYCNTDKLLHIAGLKPDVTIVLFAKKFINPKNIYELSEITNSPVYWLMYDMAPFTGGCHYAWDCLGYQSTCGNCPGLYSSDPFDITFANLDYKKSYFDKSNIQLIAGSEWQYRQAKSSSLFKNKTIYKLLLPVNSSVFAPIDKEKLRLERNIASSMKIIFFGSVYMSQVRKGMHYLLESLKILKDRIKGSYLQDNILLLIAGNQIDEIAESLPFKYKYLGVLDNTQGIASAYQTADVFICPSIEDSGPTMINQSLMCGTPVVAFEMGVALDIVINGKTGYRAKLKDSNDLAQGLYNILTLNERDYRYLADYCREFALEQFSNEVHIELFENILLQK
jgi:glycosyltransferase involved in cell wall biosynthesis